MADRSSHDLQRLSNAIINAILRSEEVKGLVYELMKKGCVRPEDVLALTLKFPTPGIMEAQMGEMNREETTVEIQQENNSASSSGQYVDGKLLTENECAFYEYLADRFDVDAWLEQVRLTLNFPEE